MRSTERDLRAAAWRKSSYSNQTGGDCVEVADGHAGIVPVRDSKNPTGPALIIPATGWEAFVDDVRASRTA